MKNARANGEWNELISQATAGDKAALETIVTGIQDMVFNLSLRMLGSFADAEDATQDILLKVITHLSAFKGESAFTTWAFRIAVNHLINSKKHRFAHMPLTLEGYADDIENAPVHAAPDLTQDVDKALLSEELKMSCTNVMLQCLDAESRCIFILGTMFKLDSRLAGDVLDMTPEAYRQRLSRVRRKMADFLSRYCGEYGGGRCRCKDRLNYAVQTRRLDPGRLDYVHAAPLPENKALPVKQAMEEIDELSGRFSFCKAFEPPERTRQFLRDFLRSNALSTVKHA